MIPDTAYVAGCLRRLGNWEAALEALGADGDPELRAELTVERWFFLLTGHDEAEQAVAALDPATPTAQVLRARLAYSRLLFGRDPRPGDRIDAEDAYRSAVRDGDESTRAWAEFHWGALLENIDRDAAAARPHFESALEAALKTGDRELEAMAIRHQAAHAEPAECVRMLRRSLHLRGALGIRPQILAAQAALAWELPEDDPERADLVETCSAGAEELGIAWLLGGGFGRTEDLEV